MWRPVEADELERVVEGPDEEADEEPDEAARDVKRRSREDRKACVMYGRKPEITAERRCDGH
jgi:hypothetical protein